MTAEHRVIVGLADIKSITFQCLHLGCGARISVSPDRIVPEKVIQCPMCLGMWLGSDPAVIEKEVRGGAVAPMLVALMAARKTPHAGVRVLLEFDEPQG